MSQQPAQRTGTVRNGELSQWMAAAIGCVLGPRSAVYVSTPITTGERFVTWRRSAGARLEHGGDAYRARLLDAVIEPNRADVAPLVDELRKRFDSPVIDPTALEDVRGWEQFDYHRFWTDVIETYAHTVVFADGWPYSSGCVLELAAAVTSGTDLLRQDLAPLAPDEALRLVQDAIADISTDEVLPQEPLLRALAVLRAASSATRTGRMYAG